MIKISTYMKTGFEISTSSFFAAPSDRAARAIYKTHIKIKEKRKKKEKKVRALSLGQPDIEPRNPLDLGLDVQLLWATATLDFGNSEAYLVIN